MCYSFSMLKHSYHRKLYILSSHGSNRVIKMKSKTINKLVEAVMHYQSYRKTQASKLRYNPENRTEDSSSQVGNMRETIDSVQSYPT